MNIYYKHKAQFIADCELVLNKFRWGEDNKPEPINENDCSVTVIDTMKRQYLEILGIEASVSEVNSWIGTFMYLKDVINLLNEEVEIVMESVEEWGRNLDGQNCNQNYPCRADVMIAGHNIREETVILVLEMKQWSNNYQGNNNFFNNKFDGGENPSQQALCYCEYLCRYNELVRNGEIILVPIVCCYNLENDDVLGEERRARLNGLTYNEESIEVFYTGEEEKTRFRRYIEDKLNYTYRNNSIFSKFKKGMPGMSSSYFDRVQQIFSNDENQLTLRIDQIQVYNTIKRQIERIYNGEEVDEHQIIIEGGSGSGKSVVALKLLCDILNNYTREEHPLNIYYCTPQGGPIDTYRFLANEEIINHIITLGDFISGNINCDVLIVDEAQLIFNQIPNERYRLLVLFCDSKQFDPDKEHFYIDLDRVPDLVSQFRCNRDEGYLSFVDSILFNRNDYDLDASCIDFDIRLVRDINSLISLKRERRHMFLTMNDGIDMVNTADDCIIQRYSRQDCNQDPFLILQHHNPGSYYSPYYYIRGLEGDSIVVYIPEEELWLEDNDEIGGSESNKRKYYVLLTRGMQSCYIYCENENLRYYLHDKKMIPWYYAE